MSSEMALERGGGGPGDLCLPCRAPRSTDAGATRGAARRPCPAIGVLPTSRSLPPGTVIHWDSRVTARSVGRTRTAPIASTPGALLHAMACLPRRDAVALIDAALNRSYCTLAQLRALRPRSGRLRFDHGLRAADGRSQSLPESFLRLAFGSVG